MTTPNSTVSDERAVSAADAIKFLECACRNWTKVPRLSDDDIQDVTEELERFLRSRSLSTGTDAGVRVKGLVDYLWQEICELPDRSSPEDMPDAGVVTLSELTAIVETYAEMSALEQQPAASQEGDDEPVAWRWTTITSRGVQLAWQYCAHKPTWLEDEDRFIIEPLFSTPTSKGEVSEGEVERVWNAILSCPHKITGEEVVLGYASDKPGNNACAQLHNRLTSALTGKGA